jgi:hypothetical protein
MAAISNIDATVVGPFSAPISTLSASDTITIDTRRKQLAVFTNTTGGSLTVTIDGANGTTVSVNGIGDVDVSAGKAIVVGAGLSVAVVLSTIKHYTQGVVTLTGAATLKLQIFNL